MREPIEVTGLVVWTISRQRADRAWVGLHEGERAAEGLPSFGSSADGVAAVAGNIGIGGRIQVIGYDTGSLHPDAEEVMTYLHRLERDQRRAVIAYGRSCQLPLAAYLPDPRLGPVWRKGPRFDAEGRPDPDAVQVSYDPDQHRIAWCPLQLEHEDRFVAELRAEYATWRAGMLRVGWHFCGHPHLLRRWSVRPPRIAAEPWRSPALPLAHKPLDTGARA
jgi:hypothetical protein